MPRDIISEQQTNIEFVKNVHKYPCLYNYELPSYTRKDTSDKAWEEVAEAMNMSPSACRERWRNLRAVFMRTIKATGIGLKKKPYYLADVMQFVVPFLRPTTMTEAEKQKVLSMEISRAENARKDHETNLPSVEIEVADIKVENVGEDEDTAHSGLDWGVEVTHIRKRSPDREEPPPVPKKRPSVALVENRDAVASFVNSLMPELREMSSTQFKCFKRRVLVLIDDITSEIPNSSSSYNNDFSIYDS